MTEKKKIAVIGTGISGLGAAYLLHTTHDVTVFEKESRLGGHSRTIDAGGMPVDTGFIVFNHRNYPHLTAMFGHLGVATEKSDMSFGVSVAKGAVEFGSKGMFAQASNILRPKFWGMIADILRFNRGAVAAARSGQTLHELLDQMKMGQWFRQYYIQAMGAAIWSCSVETILSFPAVTFLRFFENHGLLTVNDHPQWYTVSGGSRNYVSKISAPFADKVRSGAGVVNVRREADGVIVTTQGGGVEKFDLAVLACHADQSLVMLVDASPNERAVLSAFGYQENQVVVHSDVSFMPRAKKAWASWVYLSEDMKDQGASVSLTYWMNNLQNLDPARPLFVTLNPARAPDAALVHDRHSFRHPVFNAAAIAAQAHVPAIQGGNRVYFCGAWQRYGFHEDGILSAVQVAQQLGCVIPWE